MSSRPDCIFEIHQLWQSGFREVYSNFCCSCLFEPGIIKIGLPSHTMYSNKILNFQVSTTILNACTKKSLETYWRHHVHWALKICIKDLIFFALLTSRTVQLTVPPVKRLPIRWLYTQPNGFKYANCIPTKKAYNTLIVSPARRLWIHWLDIQ